MANHCVAKRIAFDPAVGARGGVPYQAPEYLDDDDDDVGEENRVAAPSFGVMSGAVQGSRTIVSVAGEHAM